MKKTTSALAFAAMMMAAASDGRFYGGKPIKPAGLSKQDTEEAKAQRHQQYGGDQTMHDYIINGVTIRATSKKVAKKITRRNYQKQQTMNEEYKIKGWVARCKWPCPQELYFYSGDKKPIRCGSQVVNEDFCWDFNHEAFPLPPTMFPELTFESEPIEVELTIKKI